MKERGFTLIELLVVISIIATLAGLTTILVSTGRRVSQRQACISNVHQLVGALETLDGGRYPDHGGANLLLYLVRKGHIGGRDGLAVLFCPGDLDESLKNAGGVDAYASIDLAQQGQYDHLTSYAARDQKNRKCRARKGAVPALVLVADDSDDHHEGGIVIGLTGGSAKWRDRFDDYDLGKDVAIVVGDGSAIPELTCLRAD
jgi:prepilin-type N-terminal cleavage/methylation domain-containing protein